MLGGGRLPSFSGVNYRSLAMRACERRSEETQMHRRRPFHSGQSQYQPIRLGFSAGEPRGYEAPYNRNSLSDEFEAVEIKHHDHQLSFHFFGADHDKDNDFDFKYDYNMDSPRKSKAAPSQLVLRAMSTSSYPSFQRMSTCDRFCSTSTLASGVPLWRRAHDPRANGHVGRLSEFGGGVFDC